MAREHDLVVGDPLPGLVDELEALGAAVVAVENVNSYSDRPDASSRLLDAALERFGRVDASAFGPDQDVRPFETGDIMFRSFLDSSTDDLRTHLTQSLEAPYGFLKAIVSVMLDQGSGQILVFTSAYGAAPQVGTSLYSTARAAATFLVRNVAPRSSIGACR